MVVAELLVVGVKLRVFDDDDVFEILAAAGTCAIELGAATAAAAAADEAEVENVQNCCCAVLCSSSCCC